MAELSELLQSADWKSEKHVPVISTPDPLKVGDVCTVQVMVGKEVPHPNKTEHHIAWIDVYFQPDSDNFPYQLAHLDFRAHGATIQGADSGSVYTYPAGTVSFTTDKPGMLLAMSYCNVHGLWQSSLRIEP